MSSLMEIGAFGLLFSLLVLLLGRIQTPITGFGFLWFLLLWQLQILCLLISLGGIRNSHGQGLILSLDGAHLDELVLLLGEGLHEAS